MHKHSGKTVQAAQLIEFLKRAAEELDSAGDGDAAFRFEVLHQYLMEDHDFTKPLLYKHRMIGL